MLTTPAFDGLMPIQADNLQMISPGVFELTGIPAGRYFVRFRDSATGAMRERTEVDLTGGSNELDESATSAGSSVTAKVVLQNGDKVPDSLEVLLRNASGKPMAVSNVDENGQASFQGLTAGTHRVVAGTSDKVYSVMVASEGGQRSRNFIEVPADAALKVSLSLVAGLANVNGVAKRDGKAASGAMIVLVPEDREDHDLFRRDQSDQDGTFSLLNVIPGKYTILAIEDGWDLDWAKPAVIARYAEHGQSIVVTDHMSREMQLSEAVEIQPK
jgi:hypothetical protein